MGATSSTPLGNPTFKGATWADTHKYYYDLCENDPSRAWYWYAADTLKLGDNLSTCSRFADEEANKENGEAPGLIAQEILDALDWIWANILDGLNAYWDCVKEANSYWFYKIIELLKSEPPTKPAPPSPNALCILMALGFDVVIITIVGLILFGYGGPLTDALGFLSRNISSFVQSVAGYIYQFGSYVIFGGKYLFDFARELANILADAVGANNLLVMLNLITGIATAICAVILEFLEVEQDWEGTYFQDIFEFVNAPFDVIMDVVQHFAGKGLIYHIIKFFILPFEAGTLLLSLLIGGIWFVFEQFIQTITSDDPIQDSNLNSE